MDKYNYEAMCELIKLSMGVDAVILITFTHGAHAQFAFHGVLDWGKHVSDVLRELADKFDPDIENEELWTDIT